MAIATPTKRRPYVRRRSAYPSALTAAAVSLAAADDGQNIAAMDLVFGRIGISVPVAPRTILRRKMPRATGNGASSASVLPSTLAGHVDVDTLRADGEQFGVLDLRGGLADYLDQRLARPGNRHNVFRPGARSRAVASSILPARRSRSMKTRASGYSASASAAVLPTSRLPHSESERPKLIAMPGTAGTVQLRLPPIVAS